MVSDTPLLASLLGALTSANLSPFAQHNRERICIWRLCRPGEAPPNDGYGQGGLPAWRWWEERRKPGDKCGRRDIEKRRRAHATRHARRYTFSVGRVPALGSPAPSAAVKAKRNESMLTSLTLQHDEGRGSMKQPLTDERIRKAHSSP